jgi:ATPases involved in chromosome partitioning
MGKVYTIVNQKGGWAKPPPASTSARIWVCSNSASCWWISIRKPTPLLVWASIKTQSATAFYEALIGEQPVSDHILHNSRFHLSLLPSSPNLAGAEIELIDLPERETRLRKLIEPLRSRYDYILIDCPPSLGLLTLNGLTAAFDGVIIPVQCEYLALEGLGQLTHTLGRVRQSLFPTLDIKGVVLTMFDGRTNLSADVMGEVQRVFPNRVFNTFIPRSIRLAEAPSFGMPISVYAPESNGAKAYRALAMELLSSNGAAIHELQE